MKEKEYKFSPTLNNLIVKQVVAAQKTEGGIILPDGARPSTLQGTIIMAGPDVKNPLLKTGVIVLYDPFAGIKIPIKNEEYLVLREEDILIIITEQGV